jgi:glycosyltransferase involved in cell wall biosynthesis
MFCSVIIPTIGRPTLARAVTSVLEQQFEQAPFEVIVVNDSGKPLAAQPWQQSESVTVIPTNRRERSFARNCGAAVAQGEYIYFLDDDDWLLPSALETSWELAQRAPQASWLHGGVRVVGADGHILAERNSGLEGNCLAQVMGGAWVPIQSSIVRAADFHALGGYSPFIRGTEDQDLCRRMAARGMFANTPAVVACLFRGDDWQTSTDYGRATEDTRRSRNDVISQPGILRRMLASADGSYWHGRVVHVYAGLALWHWRERRPLAAASCGLQGAAAMLLSLPHAVRPDFCRALRDDHVPGSLHFIQMGWERDGGDPEA